MILKASRFVFVFAATLAPALPNQIQPGNFVTSSVETYTGLSGLFPSTCSGVPCTTALPITINGNVYNTDNATLRYFANNSGCPGGDNTCINNFSDTGFIDITLASAVQAVGAYVFPATSPGVQFDFFGPTNNLLGTVIVTTNNGFGGWSDPGGITRIRVTDLTTDASSFFLDSLTTGTTQAAGVPEPASLMTVGVGLLLIGRRLSRRATM